MLSDILPTGFECGVLNGKVAPGNTVAIVGSGPIGLAALLTAQFYSPAEIIMIDLDDNRLEVAKRFGATSTINVSGNYAAYFSCSCRERMVAPVQITGASDADDEAAKWPGVA
jgi:alcohol dehydrogenase